MGVEHLGAIDRAHRHVRLLLLGLAELEEAADARAAALRAHDVERDAVEPGGDERGGVEGVELARDDHEHFLRGVLGVDAGAAEARGLAEDEVEVVAVDVLEGERRRLRPFVFTVDRHDPQNAGEEHPSIPNTVCPMYVACFKKSVTRKSLQIHAKAQKWTDLDEGGAGDGADAGDVELLAPEGEVEA